MREPDGPDAVVLADNVVSHAEALLDRHAIPSVVPISGVQRLVDLLGGEDLGRDPPSMPVVEIDVGFGRKQFLGCAHLHRAMASQLDVADHPMTFSNWLTEITCRSVARNLV